MKHGDSCSANRVDPDPSSPTSFGDDFPGPPALPYSRDDALVDDGAAASKSCLSTLEDAHTNSHRCLTPRRHSLYSDENHLRPATSLVLPDRRDMFEDFNSMRLVLKQFLADKQQVSPLLAEGHWNKIGAKSGI